MVPVIHSCSSLDVYSRCSEYYRHKYVAKTPTPLSDRSVELDAGVIVHEVLEQWLKLPVEDRPRPIDSLLERWWRAKLQEHGMANLFGVLKGIEQDIRRLEVRAQSDYDGPDAIRNAQGQVAKRPKQTKMWEDARKGLNLDERQTRVDGVAAFKHDYWQRVSISEVFAYSWAVLAGWDGHALAPVKRVIEVEKYIPKVPLPGVPGHYFMGKIDLICELDGGQIAILDHKTGRGDPPSRFEVAHTPQLLNYGWLAFRDLALAVDVIGIHHVQTQTLVLAEFDWDRAVEAIAPREAAVKGIQAGVFIKQSPHNFVQQCHDAYRRLMCPFLPICHAEYYDHVTVNK